MKPPSRATVQIPWVMLAVGLAAFFYAALILLSADGRQPGIDSHYHFLMAQEIAQGDVFPQMSKDLPLTLYHRLSVDHYWGFHLLLSPFAAMDDAEAGMKIATILMFALVILSLFQFLRLRGVEFAWAWAFLPLLLTSMDWRYLHLRGAQLMVPLLLFFIATAFYEARARRRWILVAIAYVAMLSYQGALVLFPVHVAGLVSWRLLAPATFPSQRRFEPAWTLAGLGAGLTVNPYMDSAAQTWEFAAYHVFTMGTDSENLYGRVSEFHPFPLEWLVQHPEWLCLILMVVAGGFYVIVRRWRQQPIRPEVAVGAGLAFVGLVMAARVTRATEYAVILAVVFLAALAPRRGSRRSRYAIGAALLPVLALGLWLHAPKTIDALRSHGTLHTRVYEGARNVLQSNGSKPVLNLVEADYNLLKWEHSSVSCVQGLSRYFLRPNRAVYDDVQALKASATSDLERFEILRRFGQRGIDLVANHLERVDGQMTTFEHFAKRHTYAFALLFQSRMVPSSSRSARIYGMNHRRIAACVRYGLADERCVPATHRN